MTIRDKNNKIIHIGDIVVIHRTIPSCYGNMLQPYCGEKKGNSNRICESCGEYLHGNLGIVIEFGCVVLEVPDDKGKNTYHQVIDEKNLEVVGNIRSTKS
jgi:hypothetical protein